MAQFALKTALPNYLRDEQLRIEEFARGVGLDFFPTIFEMLSYDQMNEVAAYGGFPTRYPHWRWGMEYEKLSKSHEYGLSKIYELVINNNPAIAYLLEGNSLVDQKLVMAHVYAHVDFFKNNFCFRMTSQGRHRKDRSDVRKWIDALANHGAIVRKWANRVGLETVEQFIDACLSLENLIDPQKPFIPKLSAPSTSEEAEPEETPEVPLLRVDREYMESFINPEEFVESQKKKLAEEQEQSQRFPSAPDRDVLGFLLEQAPLERWERECLAVVRAEAYYFLPQMQTKIMNEGWASYWHSRLMTESICDASEIVDYADRCASVLATTPGQLNPYKLGIELFRHIEDRWNKGQFGKEWDECSDFELRRHWDRRTGLGREKIFEVRALYNDVTFIDEYLTEDFVFDQKLYSFGYNQRNDRWEIESRQFQEVKGQLLTTLTNAGNPIISVVDANHGNRSELLLEHTHQGADLRLDWANEVCKALCRVWTRPVEIHTVVDEKPTALRFDGKDYSQKSL
ncbi:MAG: SpoVR family protein [Myxococcales bacterium]|nr:SpoVR family protein [Myxococcales bacterium]MDH3844629.1 SpoVR family protein [Myxococcales bacterium]